MHEIRNSKQYQMNKFDYNSQATSSDEFQEYSRHFVDEFLKKAKISPHLIVDLSFYPSQTAYKKENKRSYLGPIHSDIKDNCLTINLCEEILKGIPFLALQGWLDQELTCYLMETRPELYQFNFRKQILPLFPASGSAVNLIRHIIEHLKSGLKRYHATKIIIDLDHGLSQVYYHFFKISPSPEEKYNYQQIIQHNWIRATFLCQKLNEFMSICLLADRDIGFSRNLKSYWWKYNEYLLLEDKTLLEQIAAIPDKYVKKSFSYKLIEMFRKIQSCFFARPNQTMVSHALH